MNTSRRSFLKTLATAAAAFTILPAAVASQRAGWRKVPFVKRPSGIYVVNPAWRDAPYEIGWHFNPECVQGAIIRNLQPVIIPHEEFSPPTPFPMNSDPAAGPFGQHYETFPIRLDENKKPINPMILWPSDEM